MTASDNAANLRVSDLRQRPLSLRLFPDPVLRQPTSRVILFDEDLDLFFKDMLRFMKDGHGIGLAAPQVGVLKRVIVADIGDGPVKLANPEILQRQYYESMVEGCLSLPGVSVDVRRNTRIEVAGQNLHGHGVQFEATGLLARVLQHEIDHLEGRLISDYESHGSAKGA